MAHKKFIGFKNGAYKRDGTISEMYLKVIELVLFDIAKDYNLSPRSIVFKKGRHEYIHAPYVLFLKILYKIFCENGTKRLLPGLLVASFVTIEKKKKEGIDHTTLLFAVNNTHPRLLTEDDKYRNTYLRLEKTIPELRALAMNGINVANIGDVGNKIPILQVFLMLIKEEFSLVSKTSVKDMLVAFNFEEDEATALMIEHGLT